MRKIVFNVLLMALFIGCAETASGYAKRTFYVDDDAPVGGDGYSWETALPSIDVAATMAQDGDEILVAAGVYRRATDPDRPVLRMARGVAVYGGFGGESILDGQGCAMHVVDAATDAILDGFTVVGGNSRFSMAWPDYNGGGFHGFNVSGVVVTRCAFVGNHTDRRGGGAYLNYSEALFVDCDFIDNTAVVRGGGMCSHTSTVELVRCRFIGNEVTSADLGGPLHGMGGALHLFAKAWTRLLDCEFLDNCAPLGCPDIFTDDTSETIIETTP